MDQEAGWPVSSSQALARANERLAGVDGPPVEWRITFAFYAALHGVAHAINPLSPPTSKDSNHAARRDALRVARPELVAAYMTLYKLSCIARYHPEVHPMREAELVNARELATNLLSQLCVPQHAPPTSAIDA